MFVHCGAQRLGIPIALLVAASIALPMAVALAIDDQEGSETSKPQAKRQSTGAASTVAGRVTNDSGEALADVLVRIAMPPADMRFVFPGSPHKTLEATTDEDGQYKIELPGHVIPTSVSVDGMKPGYRSLAGTLMQGGERRIIEIESGTVVQASFELKPALYVKGVVVDENGTPISGVQINANASFKQSSGGIQITASSADGSFELFNYPLKPFAGENGGSKGRVYFAHGNYRPQEIDDVYALPADERESIRVIMPTGRKVWGTVLDDQGRPVAKVMVEAANKDGRDRKAVMTGPSGRFLLRGLSEGNATLRAHSMNLQQKIKMPLTLDRDHNDLKVQLQPVVRTKQPASVNVLGMTLVDVNPELKAIYDLYHENGALILDPGKDFARLTIGELAEGYCFWMAGQKKIRSVREFIEQILAETAGMGDVEQYRCRVVYSFSNVDFVGTNTQYLRLTKDDLAELRKVLAAFTEN